MIGEEDEVGDTTTRVDRIHLSCGTIASVAPMWYPRIGASVVAYDKSILVFGGYDPNTSLTLSSCEEFDSVTGRYTQYIIG